MEDSTKSYKNIFKSTFLFGFVQVFNILAKVCINKAVAVFLGAEGMGIIGLYQSTISILQTSTGLGISQSAVRDISQANGTNNNDRFSKIIGITNRIIWFSALLGAIVTICLSSFLSQMTFGNTDYTTAFLWISIVVFLNVFSEGQLAILKGMRQLRALAKASLLGSFVGLIASVPFYYFLGTKGILPSLVITAVAAVVFSWVYVGKIKYERKSISVKDCLQEGKGMVKMGIALMYVSFLGFISDYIIRAYIGYASSLEMVGIFQAGATIITGYFGVVITAMSTDYYPRISAINNDNFKLTEEVNKQSEVGLTLIGPLVVLFMFLMPFFIKILYTDSFLISIDYISYAVFGTLITVCSNAMGMILLAKQNSGVFIYSVTFSRIIGVGVNILSYKYYGLLGLGISAIVMALIHIILMQGIMYKYYNIFFKVRLIKMLLIVIVFCLSAFFVKDFSNAWLRYGTGGIVLLLSFIYSITNMKRIMNIDIFEMIKTKIIKR